MLCCTHFALFNKEINARYIFFRNCQFQRDFQIPSTTYLWQIWHFWKYNVSLKTTFRRRFLLKKNKKWIKTSDEIFSLWIFFFILEKNSVLLLDTIFIWYIKFVSNLYSITFMAFQQCVVKIPCNLSLFYVTFYWKKFCLICHISITIV